MLASALKIYTDSYKGLTRAVWALSIIQFINRSGSMVLPFMSVYLTTALGYSATTAGVIISIFGAGSMLGAYVGGRLTDSIGPFKVQTLSLIVGGTSYLFLPFFTDFYMLAAGVFICGLINDSMRPASSAMIGYFSTPETTTRSFSLLRMAINLGVAIGPAIAGILAGVSYVWLFVGDGITCIAAGLVFYFMFRDKQPQLHKIKQVAGERKQSPYRDKRFLVFLTMVFLYAAAFFQIFSSIPLYYKDVYLKPEYVIGLLIGFNGLIVFLFEMIIVSQLEKRYAPGKLIVVGTIMLGLSFFLFNFGHSMFILLASMALLSFSEIFAMPFMISHAIKTSSPATRGSYVASYTIAWSLAFILSPIGSTAIIENFDYSALWWVMGGICLITATGFGNNMMIRKTNPAQENIP